MNLNEQFAVTSAKLEALKAKITKLNIDMGLVEETHARGGGKGGQKVNKTSNAVILRYAPLGIVVKVHRERQRNLNRFLALRELVEQIEMRLAPEDSERLKRWRRIQKQKDRRRRRSGR